jgi:hypothetical protein
VLVKPAKLYLLIVQPLLVSPFLFIPTSSFSQLLLGAFRIKPRVTFEVTVCADINI